MQSTYKPPMLNMPRTFNFFLRLIWRAASSGTGKNKITRSWAIEMPELENAKVFTSTHLDDKVLSHVPATGLH